MTGSIIRGKWRISGRGIYLILYPVVLFRQERLDDFIFKMYGLLNPLCLRLPFLWFSFFSDSLPQGTPKCLAKKCDFYY